MRQAIETKYLGPSNHRGARVVAKAYAGRVAIPWSYELDTDENHLKAATALANKYGWLNRGERLIGGGNAAGTGNVYVIVNAEGEAT